MDQKTYLAKRVDDQIAWYEKKSKFNQDRYKLLKIIVIILSVSIPFLTGLINSETDILKIVVGVAGVIIAGVESILFLNKYQDLWLKYRLTAELLKREKIIFATQSGIYENKSNAFKLFVNRAEAIMSEENSAWLESQLKKEQNQEE